MPAFFSFRQRRTWLYLGLFALVLTGMNIGVVVTEDLAEGSIVRWPYYLVNEFTGVALAFLLVPLLARFFGRYPLQEGFFWRRILFYVSVSVAFGATHTILMYVVRTPLYQWLGLGSYADFYGLLGYRFLMEYFKQLLFFWAVWGVVIIYRKEQENQAQRLRAAHLEQQLTQARLQALQMQLNPHFLFNTLNMVSSVMYDDPKAADSMLADLSDMLRLTLSMKGEQEHTLERELALLERYLRIMKGRFRDRLKVDWQIEKGVKDCRVPVFLLQPVLENAIKYGMEAEGGIRISIQARQADGSLQIAVEDDGPGLSGHMRGNGLGLSNIVERMEKLYGSRARFSIRSRNGRGTVARFEIPVSAGKPD